MTGTRNPSRKYFKRNQPYFYKSVDNWEEWDTDESYDRTFFIGIDDSNPEDIDVALYMVWGGKPVAVVGDKILDTVNGVVGTARLLEEEIQSILEEVQEITAAMAQARVDLEEAIIEMDALVDRCEGILEGAEAARDLARDWATKIDGMVEEDGESVDYSAKFYANAAKDSENAASDDANLAEAWAAKMDGTVDGSEYSSKYYAIQSAGNAATAVTKAGEASDSATLASQWATQLATPVEGGEYSAKHYAQNAGTSAQNAWTSETNAYNSANNASTYEFNSSNSASASANSATLAQEWAVKMDGQVASTDYSSKYYAGQSATSAQDAQDALDNVNGLIATPIGTIFQSIYVDESIDIARALNGQLILSTKFTGFREWLNTVQTATPNLFTTEANWQAEVTNSKFGQCGKFVIDDTAGTIRLPCVVNAQGLLGLSGIGNLVNESLPNIVGSVDRIRANTGTITETGALKMARVSFGETAGGNVVNAGTLSLDASRSSSTYQDNAPVQQEAVQYPYYIQVATGVEETLPAIREYEINTPFFFGQSMYSENAPYNASWLESMGQYNSSTLYPDMYTQLNGVELNGSLNVGDTIEIGGKTYIKRELPVKLSTDTYTDYDWVVNQNDQTFRLPLLNGEEGLPGTAYENWTLQASGSSYSIEKNGTVFLSKSSTAEGQYIQISNGVEYPLQRASTSNHNLTVMMNFKRGQTAVVNFSAAGTTNNFRFIPAKGNGTLYFYVGDTVQDASLINAGAVLGQLATKTNSVEAAAASMPSNRYIDLTLGASGATYTMPANGWIVFDGAGSQSHWQLNNQTRYMTATWKHVQNIYAAHGFLPVMKGDVVAVNYNSGKPDSSGYFRFVYAEGENV